MELFQEKNLEGYAFFKKMLPLQWQFKIREYICYGKFVFLVSLRFVYLCATLRMYFLCK